MDHKISGNDIRARQDYGVANHYLSLSVTVVSLGLAAAAAAASLIAQFANLGPNRLLLCPLWLGGVLAIVVGYGGPMVGAFALPSSIPLIQDLIPPLILRISEFLIFLGLRDIAAAAVRPGQIRAVGVLWLSRTRLPIVISRVGLLTACAG